MPSIKDLEKIKLRLMWWRALFEVHLILLGSRFFMLCGSNAVILGMGSGRSHADDRPVTLSIARDTRQDDACDE